MSERNFLSLAWKEADKIARETILAALRSMCTFEPGAVLDVGAGERGYRELLEAGGTRFISLDVDQQAKPNVLGSALALPFREAAFDTVISTQTLEHLPDPILVLTEMNRVLRVGGNLLLSAPQTWPIHLAPHDFYRFTSYGLESMLTRTGFSIERMEPCGGFFATVGQMLALGAFHMGTHARHSRVRHFWRRWMVPLVNRVFLRLDRRIALNDGSVLNWVVLARRV